MTRLYIVRHGNTFAADEPPRRIGAKSDLPLVASGCEQAFKLGRHFAAAGSTFDRVFTGSLQRTRATAEIILDAMQSVPRPPVSRSGLLTEIDHGPDEGMLEEEVVRRVGSVALQRWNAEAVPPDGWRVREQARYRAWHTVLTRCTGDTLMVTSSGAARFALMSLPAGDRPPSNTLRTGSYACLERGRAKWRVVCWDVRPAEA